MIRRESSDIHFFFLSEATVDLDITKKYLKIVNENAVDLGGHKVLTLTYNTVLQSCSNENITVRNRNGRNYPLRIVWGNIQKNPLVQHDLKNGTLKGEYGHPDLGAIVDKQQQLIRQMTIDPKNECNRINKMWVEDNLIMGECTTLPGAWGDVLRDRIIAGNPAMASARALGGTDAQGNLIESTYNYITTDSVSRPGHADAYMIAGSEKINVHGLPSGNTMNESTMKVNVSSSEFANFVLSETVNKERMDNLCAVLGYDYKTLVINETGLSMQRVSPDGLIVETVVIPLRKLVGMEYHNLF